MQKIALSDKRWKIAAVAVALLIVIFVVSVVFSSSKNKIPSDFADARVSASQYAQDIVASLTGTSGKINGFPRFQTTQEKENAKGVILEEIEKGGEVREKAIALALQLEIMAKAIPDITPDGAAQTALVGISQETALISQLLSYNNDLIGLLNLLEKSITERTWDYTEINKKIASLNAQMKEINDLNGRFKQEMEKFDAFYTSPSPSASSTTSTPSTATTAVK